MSIQTASLSWVSAPAGTPVGRLNPRIVQPNINTAIEKGLFQQVRYLIEFGARVNQRDAHGRTPLMNCALVEDEQWGVGLARLLLEKNAKPYLKDAKGRNAMHYAVLYERLQLVGVYLSAMDFSLTDADRQGNSYLHYSVACGNADITTALLHAYQQYEVTADATNSTGNTPLIVACKMNQKNCANLLRDHEAVDTSICDKNGRSGDWWLDMINSAESEEDEGGNGERPNSVSSVQSLSTLGGYITPAASGGRHSRLGRYTPLGGHKHYNTKWNPSKGSTAQARRTQSRAGALGHGEVGTQSRSSVRGAGEAATGITPIPEVVITEEKRLTPRKASESTEQINTLLSSRQNHQIRSASPADFRNQPECVFHVTPMDCFSNRNLPRLSSESSAHLAAQINKGLSRDARHLQAYDQHSWRSQVKHMFDAFNFQFSPSYRKAAVIIPDIDTQSTADSTAARPPSSGTRGSELESETGSVVSKPRSASRRQSVMRGASGMLGLGASAAGGGGGPAGERMRRPSVSSNISSVSQRHAGKKNAAQ